MQNQDQRSYFASLPSIIAVVSVPDPTLAVEISRALVKGGIRAIELALRNPSGLESIRKVREAAPEMIVGAGTVIEEGQVQEVIDAGAAFAVSPGFNPRIAEEAAARGLPFAPGIATPSDIEAALRLGIGVMKVFPAKHLGGIPYMESIYTPYAHLNIRFIPLGGIREEDLVSYLKEEMIISIGGSWLASKKDIENRDWEQIRITASAAAALVTQAGGRL